MQHIKSGALSGSRGTTRREFLARSAFAALGICLSEGALYGMAGGMAEVRQSVASRRHPDLCRDGDLFGELLSGERLRALALVAMDTATHAGASFADIRIGVQRGCGSTVSRLGIGYGVRACVDGAWGFEHGIICTPDAVAAATRSAVSDARTAARVNRGLRPSTTSWAPAPVVTGEWRVPVEIDPFTVPVDDFRRIERLLAESVQGMGHVRCLSALRWSAETRVFASTDGSLVTQSFIRGGPQAVVQAWLPEDPGDVVSCDALEPETTSVGFESVLRNDAQDRVVAAAEEAMRWRELPRRAFQDVGRFPVVFDGHAFASVVGQTLDAALDGDRLSGLEADASGRSFLEPVLEFSKAQSPLPLSPLLTLTANDALPSGTARHWDDDGVLSVPCTLVERGAIVNVYTTRETAPRFESWYQRRGVATPLHGHCVAPTPASFPVCASGNVIVTPGAAAHTPFVMARDIPHGFFVRGADVRPVSGLSAGFLGASLVIELVRGKPVARLQNVGLAFSSKGLLNTGLVALGDASTVGVVQVSVAKGMPWQEISHPVTAPAAYCRDIDVIRTDLQR